MPNDIDLERAAKQAIRSAMNSRQSRDQALWELNRLHRLMCLAEVILRTEHVNQAINALGAGLLVNAFTDLGALMRERFAGGMRVEDFELPEGLREMLTGLDKTCKDSGSIFAKTGAVIVSFQIVQ